MSESQAQVHPVIERLRERFGDAVREAHAHRGDLTAVIGVDEYHNVMAFLRDDPVCVYDFLTDLSGLDRLRLHESPRFEVVVHLYSTTNNHRLRIKTHPVDDANPTVPSITDIYPAANWPEREVWDMFGVRFTGHPNLKRILMYEEFVGHPLRKDYPVNKRQPLVVERPVHDDHNPRLFYV